MSDGEFDRIQRLSARFAGPAAPAVGIGDDAAVLPAVDGPLVITTDASVEDVHFRRSWAALDRIGYRAAQAAMSDLAAMCADPSMRGGGVLYSLELPALDERAFDALIDGLARAAESHRAPVLGGNLARSSRDTLSITTTALGVARRSALRSGARAGDSLYLSGPVGGAALGLRALLAGRTEDALRPCIEQWLAPRAHIVEGLAIASVASSAIDVSDGLTQDASHIAEASRVALVIDADALPISREQHACAQRLGLDAIDCALSGGEDYVLLFTAPAQATTPSFATRIGVVQEGRGVFVVRDGSQRRVERGWDHFST